MADLKRYSPRFWAFAVFAIMTFLMGGGARGDVQSLVLLRPIAAVACGLALWTLSASHVRQYRFLITLAAAVVGFVGIELIPLPPSIWSLLPGREIVTEIDRLAGAGAVWRPITMAPDEGWNALFSLLVPGAALLLGVQLGRDERAALLPLLIVIGALSGLLGFLQALGGADGPLYLYRVTNGSSAVGLFANRNHSAVFLTALLPMLAVFAANGGRRETRVIRRSVAGMMGLALVPLVLITGSRAGLISAFVGLVAMLALHRRDRTVSGWPFWREPWLLASAAAAVGLIALLILFSRAEALNRLLDDGEGGEARIQLWGPAWRMAWSYFPVGSGVGSFVQVFQLGETTDILDSTFANHAHNDWLEIWMTGGVAGVGLVLTAAAAVARQGWTVWRLPHPPSREVALARLGAVILLMFALASFADYPLRVPSLMVLMVVAALWLRGGTAAGADRQDGIHGILHRRRGVEGME